MSYTKTPWTNKTGNPINDVNLNHLEQGIKDAHTLIADLSDGEFPQGAWTPAGGSEYPSSPQVGYSWYISGLDENGYLYTTGILTGETAFNFDKIIYTSIGWSLIEANATYSIPNGAIGNINNPLLDLPLNNSLDMKQGVGSVTFTRTTTGTYVDRYGVLQTAAIDEARFEKEGLLIEGGSTNKLLYSEDFTDTAWIKETATIVADSTIAPDGVSTTHKLSNSSSSSEILRQFKTFPASSDVSGGVWVKGTQGASVFIQASRELTGGGVFAGETNEYICSGEWERLGASFTMGSDNTTAEIRVYSDNASNEFYVWGAQLEELPFASSYIPTTASAVTRGEEICEIDFADNCIAGYSSSTTIVDASTLGIASVNQWLYSSASRYGAYFDNNSNIITQEGTSVQRDTGFNYVENTFYRIATSFDLSTLKPYIDGVLGNEVLSTINTSNTSKIRLGNYTSGGLNLYGHIRNFRIFDKALIASEIALA